jgi:hypothetical protein
MLSRKSEFGVCIATGYGQQSLTSCTFMEQDYLATFYLSKFLLFFGLEVCCLGSALE